MGHYESKERCPLCGREIGRDPWLRYVKDPTGATIACHADCADIEETQQRG